MCLIIKRTTKPIMAKRNIKVFKFFDIGLKSYFRQFKYEKNRLYETDFSISEEGTAFADTDNELKHGGKNRLHVQKGFHCVTERQVHFWRTKLHRSNTQIEICIIPKGALYYRGYRGLLCANKIIIS